MVAALAHPNSIFAVIGTAARRRSVQGLVAQLASCAAIGAALLVLAPQWWSVAALVAVPGAYAAWGLVVHVVDGRPSGATVLRAVSPIVAALGTMLAVAGIVGLAVALFTGNGRSPYDSCGPGAHSRYCQAIENPPTGHVTVP